MANTFEEELALEEELPEAVGAGEAEGILGAIGIRLGGLLGEEEVHEQELPEVHELHELPEIHELGEEEASHAGSNTRPGVWVLSIN